LLWDRKTEGGFPETKVLKQLVRDRIDPKKDLGHSDKGGKKKVPDGMKESARQEQAGEKETNLKAEEVKRNLDGTICEDCR
jgi:hypothetical protein